MTSTLTIPARLVAENHALHCTKLRRIGADICTTLHIQSVMAEADHDDD